MLREINWLKSKQLHRQLRKTGILLVPVVLYFISIDWLEHRHSICLFKNITGNDCYGCGMSRAMLSALHFQFANAFKYNKLFVVVLPLIICIWIKYLIKPST